MICKFCGRLVTTKNKCLCCGSSTKHSSSSKLTPQQLAEYELLAKQREEESLKLEEERIKSEQERVRKAQLKATKTMTIFGFITLVFSLLVVFVFKANSIGNVGIHAYNSHVESIILFSNMALVVGLVSAILFTAVTVLKKKCGKNIIAWLVLAVLSGVCCVYGGIRNVPDAEMKVTAGVKNEYSVGEELELHDLRLQVMWDTGYPSYIDNSTYMELIDNKNQISEAGKLYVYGFDTSEAGTSKTLYFEYVLEYEETEHGGGRGSSVNIKSIVCTHTYSVV